MYVPSFPLSAGSSSFFLAFFLHLYGTNFFAGRDQIKLVELNEIERLRLPSSQLGMFAFEYKVEPCDNGSRGNNNFR